MTDRELHFIVEGKPIGKGRPRFSGRGGFIRTYNPQSTVDYEEKVKQSFLRQVGNEFSDYTGALSVEINAYFEPPKSASKKKRNELIESKYYLNKPDSDNIAKIVLDGLNKVAYYDDNQIVQLVVTKQYSEQDRVEVKIEFL